ncbi:MAG: DUF3078 domain-containing protein [Flavobacteriaceae bacterium]|nr:DUF3078 domain-containing protein [Flavobacteriaceae bacterium]
MKKILFVLGTLSFGVLSAQETTEETPKTGNWSIEGQNTLMLNQAAFSNWVGGGANNLGWLVGTNYNFTYQKDKDLWENTIVLGYGQNDTQGLGKRKTQDIINLSSNYGRSISKNWYASAGVSFATQFTNGYEDGNNPSAEKISNFMAPGYLNLGAGFTYKPSENFTATVRPANARMTFVMDKDLQKKGKYGLKNDGDSMLFQFGLYANATYKIQLMENVHLSNTAWAFSNYLDHPERIALGYSGVLNFKVNKYISSNVTLDLVYDHNQIQRTQLKQTLGIGFAYNISNGVKRANTSNLSDWKQK